MPPEPLAARAVPVLPGPPHTHITKVLPRCRPRAGLRSKRNTGRGRGALCRSPANLLMGRERSPVSFPVVWGIHGQVPMSFARGGGSKQTSVMRLLPGAQECPSLGGDQLQNRERCCPDANLPLSCSVPKSLFGKPAGCCSGCTWRQNTAMRRRFIALHTRFVSLTGSVIKVW